MRHLNISYTDLVAMPEKKVWRLYAMLIYEFDQRKKQETHAAGKHELKPPYG